PQGPKPAASMAVGPDADVPLQRPGRDRRRALLRRRVEQELSLPDGGIEAARRSPGEGGRPALQGPAVHQLPRDRSAASRTGSGQRGAEPAAREGAPPPRLDPALAEESPGAAGGHADAQLLGLQRRSASHLAEQALQRGREGADRRLARLPDAPGTENHPADQDSVRHPQPRLKAFTARPDLNKSPVRPVQVLTVGEAFASSADLPK